MKTLITILAALLVGCGHEGTAPDAPAKTSPDAPAFADVHVTPVPTATPVPGVSLDYYAKTATRAPIGAAPTKTYTATGYCTVYTGDTYCWDDGVKTITVAGFTYRYSYWNVSKNAVGWSVASGGLQADLMIVPTLIAVALNANLPAGMVSDVLSTGVVATASCVDTAGVLDCGTFSVDTTQAPL